MEKTMISGKCPYCKNDGLLIKEGDSVECPYCDKTVTAEQLKAKPMGSFFADDAKATLMSAGGLSQFAMQIENPASGLAYLENRFETMDWEDFETNLVFELEGVSTIIEKNKVTNANDPNSWLLEYRSITEVILHKLNGLKTLCKKIEAEYNPLDLTGTFASFDHFSKLTRALIDRRSSTYKVLESDIRFLEKFKAPEETLADVKNGYSSLKEQYDAVSIVEKIEEIPEVKAVIEKAQKAIVDSLLKEGIVAEELYQEAVKDFDSSTRNSVALSKFQKLNGYKDSSDYIAKINSLSVFGNVIEANGKQYYFSTKNNTLTFDVSNPAANAEATYQGMTLSLYAIENKEYDPKKPIVTDITFFLASYNGKLFFISKENTIKAFDFASNTETVLDSGELNCYELIDREKEDSRRFIWGPDRTSIYIKKRLNSRPAKMEKRGCFKKSAQQPPKQLNNFSLLKLNLAGGFITTVIPELVDIMDVFGDYVFFTQSRNLSEVKEGKKGKTFTVTTQKTFFSSYNMKSDEMLDVLSENDCIVNAVDGKIVYVRYSAASYNQDLYVYDIANKTSLLLEKNIYYAYNKIHNDKILYTVGNSRRSSMFSIKLDGTERTEILLNVVSIQYFDKNWMYVIKGPSYNKTLIKISYDGKKRVFVASGIKTIIEMTSGYIYYVDYDGYLCVVRNDGKEDHAIIDACENAKIVIHADSIFIMRPDNSEVSSLYQVDLEGHNLKKLYFGLEKMDEIDKQRIFFLHKEKRKYKITTPQKKGDPVISYTERMIKTYYSLDKRTNEIKEFLVIGAPKSESYEFKRGCFGRKKVTEHSTIEDVTKELVYRRTGKMKAGQVTAEKEAESMEKSAASPRK